MLRLDGNLDIETDAPIAAKIFAPESVRTTSALHCV